MACQIDHLCELPTDALRREALKRLPPNLHETYARILRRISEPSRPLVQRALRWLVYAVRPPPTAALLEIVSVDENAEVLDAEACPDIEDLLRCCGSLVRTDAHVQTIELAHFTVQEFLEAIQPDDAQLKDFRLSKADTLTLAMTCINYLCLPSFDCPVHSAAASDVEGHGFYGYANWVLPIYVKEFADNSDFRVHLRKLFKPNKSHNLTRFVVQRIRARFNLISNEPLNDDDGCLKEGWVESICSHEFSSLHAAAMFHFDTVCQWLLDQQWDASQASALGSPLECALYGFESVFTEAHANSDFGHLFEPNTRHTISILLKAGAACDALTAKTSSLSLLAFYGPDEIFVDLLQHGMPLLSDAIDEMESYGFLDGVVEHCIHSILSVKNADIPVDVRLQLLNLAQAQGIDVTATVPYDKTMSNDTFFEAVAYAVKFGPASTLRTLAIDDRFSLQQSEPLLHMAAEHRSPESIRILLDRGFDPAHLDESGRTVLHNAVRSGMKDADTLYLLVQSDVAEVQDHHSESVWHVAAERNRLDILDLLVSHYGSDHYCLHAQDKSGNSPLLKAILGRHNEFASRLMRLLPPEKTFATDTRVLHFVVGTGSEDLLQELIEMGADMGAVSDRGRTALYFITAATSHGMLDMLLAQGLDLNHLDSEGRSPLVDLLEVTQRLLRCKPLGESDLQVSEVDLSIVSTLATPFCATSPDREGNLAWLHFCTKMVPHFLLVEHRSPQHQFLVGVSSVLIDRGALTAYNNAAEDSGIGLLIRTCLESMVKVATEDREAFSLSIAVFLRHVLTATAENDLLITNPQVPRLLIWSITQSESALFEKLLELGVDVHATSEDYDGDSAVDVSIEGEVGQRFFEKLLDHAESHQIPKLDARGLMRHHVLLTQRETVDKEHLTQGSVHPRKSEVATAVWKLEAILKKGVDPNLRSQHGCTAAHIAASSGNSEAIKTLVAHRADLTLLDRYGWSVVHHAAAGRHVNVLKDLRLLPDLVKEWYRPATITVLLRGSPAIPYGPLAFARYTRCSLAHFAAYGSNSQVLEFLQENKILGDIDARCDEGVTLLHFAACSYDSDTIRWLLLNGADVDAKCGTRGISALHIAMRWGCLEAAITLIEAGAKFAPDSAGITPETLAHPTIREELINILPQVGVPIPPTVLDVIRRDHKRQSSGSLMRTIISGDLQACSTIIEAASRFPEVIKGCGKCTPLIVALEHDQLEIASFFLSVGASTGGNSCMQIDHFGIGVTALELAIQRPVFNSLLEQILERCLLQETHWSQRSNYWRPFHIAAALNSDAIKILANHVLKHQALIK